MIQVLIANTCELHNTIERILIIAEIRFYFNCACVQLLSYAFFNLIKTHTHTLPNDKLTHLFFEKWKRCSHIFFFVNLFIIMERKKGSKLSMKFSRIWENFNSISAIRKCSLYKRRNIWSLIFFVFRYLRALWNGKTV